MGAPDRGSGEDSLDSTWTTLGGRLAAAAGAATALVALLCGVPVRIASLRGALACLGVLAVSRLAGLALARLAREAPEDAGAAPAAPHRHRPADPAR